ncbi:MAG: nuclear transport factor 2 family protein [Bacteroidota bacterium]
MKVKLALFFLLVFSAIDSHSQSDSETVSYLKQFRVDYKRSMIEKNPGLLSVYYSSTIRLMPEFQKTIVGKNNALLFQRLFCDRFEVKEYERTEVEIHDLKSKVLEIGMFTMKVKLMNTIHNITGKYFNIWDKSTGGTLLLETEAWNYNHKIDFGDQLKFNEVPVVDVAMASHVPINDNISFELAALNSFIEAIVSSHDPKLWLQLYTDDGMFCYSGNPIKKGKKDLGEFFIEHCKDLPVFEKLSVRNDHIDHLGEFIIEYASHVAVIRSGDFSGVFTGKDLAIWRREKDGSLKIFRHIGMYD